MNEDDQLRYYRGPLASIGREAERSEWGRWDEPGWSPMAKDTVVVVCELHLGQGFLVNRNLRNSQENEERAVPRSFVGGVKDVRR